MTGFAEIPCPVCGTANAVHHGLLPADVPRPGDVYLCGSCLTPAMFDGDPLSVRAPTPLEMLQIDERTMAPLGALLSGGSIETALARWRKPGLS